MVVANGFPLQLAANMRSRRLLSTQTSSVASHSDDNDDPEEEFLTQVSAGSEDCCVLCKMPVSLQKLPRHLLVAHPQLQSKVLNTVQFCPPVQSQWQDCDSCKKCFVRLNSHRCKKPYLERSWEDVHGPLILNGSKCPFCQKNDECNIYDDARALVRHISDDHRNLTAATLEQLWPGAFEDCPNCQDLVHIPYRAMHAERCGRAFASAPLYPPTTLAAPLVVAPPLVGSRQLGVSNGRSSVRAVGAAAAVSLQSAASQSRQRSGNNQAGRSAAASIPNVGATSSGSAASGRSRRAQAARTDATGSNGARSNARPHQSSASSSSNNGSAAARDNGGFAGIGSSPQEDSPDHEDAEAAVDHDDVAVDLPIADALQLLGWFHYNMHKMPYQWKDNIRSISRGLLQGIVDTSRDSIVNDRCFLAFFLLPGIIEFVRRDTKRGLVMNTLEQFADAPDVAAAIIKRALHLREQFPHLARQQEMQNAAALDPELQRAVQDRDLRRMYTQSYKNGRYKNAKNNMYAVQDLSRGQHPPERLTPEQERENVETLFPAANELDSFPAEDVAHGGQPLPPSLQLSPEHVRDVLPKLDKDTAPGISGLTMAYFLNIFGGRTLSPDGTVSPPTEEQSLLTTLYNKILTNSVSELMRAVLTGSRVVIIPKKGISPAGVGRPLGIGEVLYRVLGKIISNVMGKQLADVMAPLQLAVGVKDSCIIMDRVLQQMYDDGYAILSLDLENAFNTVRRRQLYDSCRELAPELLGILRFSYEEKSELRDSHGDFIKFCETGVRQGDPLAMIFFCIAAFKLLQELEDCRKRVTEAARREARVDEMIRGGLTMAYADDVFCGTEVQLLEVLLPEFIAILERAGFKVNVSKCSIVAKNLDLVGVISEDVIQSTEGCIYLGAPVGAPDYVRRILRQKIASKELDPRSLGGLVKPEEMFRLVSLCINPSVVYLRRAAGYGAAKAALLEFDQAIEKLLLDTLDVKVQTTDTDGTALSDEDIRLDIGLLHNRTVQLLRTPLSLGGLGVYAHFGMEGERSELVVRLRVSAFLRAHSSLSICRYPDPNTQDDIRIGQSEGFEEYIADHTILAADNDTFYCNMRIATTPNLTRQAILAVHKARLSALYERLRSLDEDHPYLAYLRSATEDAGSGPLAWLKGFYGSEMKYFKEVVQLYLGVSSIPTQVSRGRNGCRCACGRLPGFAHALLCSWLGGRRTKRHHMVVAALAKLIKDMFPEYTVTVEEVVGTNARNGNDVRADIVVRDAQGRVKFVIDVAIVMPSAEVYLKRPICAHERKDAAAVMEEEQKKNIYIPLVPLPTIIPFVLESTGRLGPAAKDFVKKICGTNTFRRSQFITQCSWILAVGAGQMVQLAEPFLTANA